MAYRARKNKDEFATFSYDDLTDEEIDLRICGCIKASKEDPHHNNYRWSDEDIALRNYAIWKLLYKQGKSRVDTMRNLKGRWGVHQSTIYEYIKIAENEVNETYNEMKDDYRAKNMEKAQKLYDYAVEHNQPKVALQALDMINKLQGLYTENKTVTVNDIRFEFD